MDPSEIEFVAEKESVKIIPNFSADKIYLIEVSVRRHSRLSLILLNVKLLTGPTLLAM